MFPFPHRNKRKKELNFIYSNSMQKSDRMLLSPGQIINKAK